VLVEYRHRLQALDQILVAFGLAGELPKRLCADGAKQRGLASAGRAPDQHKAIPQLVGEQVERFGGEGA
jgi:hypothetical protein